MYLTIQIEYFGKRSSAVSFWQGPFYIRFATREFSGHRRADMYATELAKKLHDAKVARCDFRVVHHSQEKICQTKSQ